MEQNGVYCISVQSLAKDEAKELQRVVRAYGAACTVKRARDYCSPGPVMTVIYTALVVGLFVGLALLWLPFLLCALVTLVAVPLRVATSTARWVQLLPPGCDDLQLMLV